MSDGAVTVSGPFVFNHNFARETLAKATAEDTQDGAGSTGTEAPQGLNKAFSGSHARRKRIRPQMPEKRHPRDHKLQCAGENSKRSRKAKETMTGP